LISAPPPPPSATTSPAPGDKAVAIVGPSNSGKTELICRLLEWFVSHGVRVAVLKHSHKLHLGDEGKDTWRYRQSGGRLVALAAPGLLQVTRALPEEPSLAAVLAELTPEVDLILVEGYKTSDLPKVALPAAGAALPLPDYPRLVAWVSPAPLPTDLPVFHPREVADIGRFIQQQLACRHDGP
jgi:molybdopterin-guanine dinucleotide biosynthesis protein B